MEDSLLDLLVHLFMTALLAAALCVASIVAAGGLALLIWAVARVSRGIAAFARWVRAGYARRTRRPRVPHVQLFPHRLRRP